MPPHLYRPLHHKSSRSQFFSLTLPTCACLHTPRVYPRKSIIAPTIQSPPYSFLLHSPSSFYLHLRYRCLPPPPSSIQKRARAALPLLFFRRARASPAATRAGNSESPPPKIIGRRAGKNFRPVCVCVYIARALTCCIYIHVQPSSFEHERKGNEREREMRDARVAVFRFFGWEGEREWMI